MPEGEYIRGGGGIAVDGHRVGMVLAVGVVVALAACTLWQGLSTASDNARADRLRHAGVPVEITVTGCSGISSGIGMGIEFYRCEGTYTLNGAQLTGLIHGSQALLATGRVVPGRVVPSDPTTLTLTGPGSSRPPTSSVGSYTVTMVLGALTLIGAIGLWFWWARARRGERPVPVA
jgi:hypothetical protein